MQDHIVRARAFGVEDSVSISKLSWSATPAAAESIRPLVCDTAYLLRDAMKSRKNLLFEGAQGTMLDIDHGTYPFVTSSSACSWRSMYRNRRAALPKSMS